MNLFNPNFQNPYQNNYNAFTPANYQVNTNNINWVQGIEGAKAFQLKPNDTVMMLDSENDGIFYIKVSDNVGMCTLRTFRYTEITDTQSQKLNPDEYVKKSELEELIKTIIGGKTDEQPVQTAKSNKTITH